MAAQRFGDDLRDYFYYDGNIDLQVEVDDNTISIYLDLPSEANYDSHMILLEEFFSENNYDVEDFDIDGDYEGTITLEYIL